MTFMGISSFFYLFFGAHDLQERKHVCSSDARLRVAIKKLPLSRDKPKT